MIKKKNEGYSWQDFRYPHPRKIYLIRHNITGRTYIGCSKKIRQRIQHHLSALKCGKHIIEDMQSDYDRYGDDFTISIIEEVDYEHRHREYEWMKVYKSYIRGIGYNYHDWMAKRHSNRRLV